MSTREREHRRNQLTLLGVLEPQEQLLVSSLRIISSIPVSMQL